MSSVFESRKQYDLRTVSRNSESSDTCYVCGASQAYWSVYSKPTGDEVPFFPFLEYHKPPNQEDRIDKNGRVQACNVCYSFLIQQWDSYEANKTPILKRLYWLKRANADSSRSQSPATSVKSDFATDCLSDFGGNDKYMPRFTDDLTDNAGKSTEQDDSAVEEKHGLCEYGSDVVETSGESPGVNTNDMDFHKPKVNQARETGVFLESCFLCGIESDRESMKIVHSRAQIKPDTPFFPCLLQWAPQAPAKPLDSQGKGLVCSPCHAYLFSQWQVFQANNTPVSQRKYQLLPESGSGHETKRSEDLNEHDTCERTDDGRKAVINCSVCSLSQSASKGSKICAQKWRDDEPFYPFLKNLRSQSFSISQDGWADVCSNCKSSLQSQWKEFEKAGVAVEDRVYRSSIKREKSPSPIPSEQEILCFVCGKSDMRRLFKSVYCNPYANMDFEFLEKLQHKPGSVFSRELGEALVCGGCYHSLKSQWMHFELHQVPRNSRRFQLHTIFRDDKPGKEQKRREVSDVESCEICEVECPREATAWLDVFPTTSERHSAFHQVRPFFPFLARWKSQAGQERLKVCKLCFANLYAQWSEYENNTEEGQQEDPWKRKYRVHHFTCYSCGNSVHRTSIRVVPRLNYTHLLERRAAEFAVQLEEFIAICIYCKDRLDGRQETRKFTTKAGKGHDNMEWGQETERQKTSKDHEDDRQDISPNRGSAHKDSLLKSVDVCEDVGMKATATVPPLPTIMMGSQAPERGPVQNQGDDREGSFAAALRKLAQQAIIPERSHGGLPDRQGPPKVSSSKQSGHANLIGLPDGRLAQSPGSVVVPPYSSSAHSRGGAHPGPPLSVMAPIAPPVPMMDIDKPDLGLKGSLGRSPPGGTESPSRRSSRQVLPGIFARPGPDTFRPGRDEHRPHGGESSPRDLAERHQSGLPGNGFSLGTFSGHNTKDRSSSNVGLVHPQPVRKLPEEDHGSKLLSSARCPSREPPSSIFRPSSPSEAFSRFGPLSAAIHNHGSQAPCPVHGHESGHRHGSPGEHGARPHGLPFESLAGSGLSDIRPYHAHRFREEFYPLHRHGIERKEPFPHHMIEEDLRRRGYDWSWPPVQPAFYDTEQYRRHLLSSLRTHEHPYKDMPHSQLYYSSLPYYGREFPLPVDPYLHPSLVGGSDPYQHRHGPPLSPRLAEYYRRTELGLLDRPRDPHELHRHPDNRPERTKEERSFDRDRPRSSEEGRSRMEGRKHDIRNVLNHDKDHEKDMPKESPCIKNKPETRKALLPPRTPNNASHDYRHFKPQPSPKKNMLLHGLGLLPQTPSESPSATSEAQIQSNRPVEKPFQSRINFSIADSKFLSRPPGLEEKHIKQDTDTELHELNDESMGSDDVDSNEESYGPELEIEDKDKKMNYMNSLGLVPHGKRRALEEDYERRRWERKFRKFRGRPRKRTKREATDESDSRDRPGSELDFYTGPMTRHKQQLLQEQENLLEQIQKSKEDIDDEKENRTEDMLTNFDSSKDLSPSLDQNSPRRSFLLATSCHHSNKAQQPLSIDTVSIEAAMKSSSQQKSSNDSTRLLTFYRRGDSGKSQSSEIQRNLQINERAVNIKQEENQTYSPFLQDRGKTTTVRPPAQAMRWMGTEEVARAYTAHRQDQEMEETVLRRAFESLKSEEDILNHQSQQLKKDMMVLHEVKMKVGDEKQKLRWTMENLHQIMRTIATS